MDRVDMAINRAFAEDCRGRVGADIALDSGLSIDDVYDRLWDRYERGEVQRIVETDQWGNRTTRWSEY